MMLHSQSIPFTYIAKVSKMRKLMSDNHNHSHNVGCSINYHHNYHVENNWRIYYHGVPEIIQVSKHQFVEQKVIELWTTLMLVSWYINSYLSI